MLTKAGLIFFLFFMNLIYYTGNKTEMKKYNITEKTKYTPKKKKKGK